MLCAKYKLCSMILVDIFDGENNFVKANKILDEENLTTFETNLRFAFFFHCVLTSRGNF